MARLPTRCAAARGARAPRARHGAAPHAARPARAPNNARLHTTGPQVELVNDDWRRWQVKLPPAAFDDDLPGGAALRQDLQRLARDTGGGYILMEAKARRARGGGCPRARARGVSQQAAGAGPAATQRQQAPLRA
jgi:hypothetical protein